MYNKYYKMKNKYCKKCDFFLFIIKILSFLFLFFKLYITIRKWGWF